MKACWKKMFLVETEACPVPGYKGIFLDESKQGGGGIFHPLNMPR